MASDTGPSHPRSGMALWGGRALVVLSWLALAAVTALVASRSLPALQAWSAPSRERFDALDRAYDPFKIQHINPFYLFSLPFHDEDRLAANNEICSVDANGFRGRGPEYADGRPLAFLIGGSSAFGHLASSDEATITGYLNRLQDEFFFVNAGVPSWNTTQELFRVVRQLLEYEPALIVTFDGANDTALMLRYFTRVRDYPAGTPESFDRITKLVNDIRSTSLVPGPIRRIWSRVTGSTRERRDVSELPTPVLDDHVARYLFNLEIMRDVVGARGARFLAVYQPIIWLHDNGPESLPDPENVAPYRRFHDAVLERHDGRFELLDLGAVFDEYFEEVPYFDADGVEDIGDDAIFLDAVHLFDPGNEIVAQRIAGALDAP